MDKDLMGRLTFLQGGPPKGTDQAMWELYQPRSLSFAARNREAARELVTEAGLRRTVEDLKRRLQSPLSTLVSRIAPQDPFLALPHLFESLDQGQGQSLSIVDERFIAEDRYAVLLFGTRDSALDADAQRAVFAGLKAAFRRLNNSALKLETSSLARYSIQAERTIKSDIQRITWVSVIGMLTLCLLLFGSLRLMLLALVPVAAGMLAGLTTTLLIYGQVHGLTLAVGASLIGVCIDYVVHFYAHQLLVPAEHPFGTMRRIWTGLLLGCSTTAIGFLVLAGSSFPGLRQISLFASSGVVVALATTRWVVPMLVDKRSVSKPLLRRLAEGLQSSLVFVHGSGKSARLRGWTLLALAIAMSATGAWCVTWDDDMANLAKADPQLQAEDERVRQRVGRFDMSRFVVAAGADEEHALQVNDQVTEILLRARQAGDLGGWQNIASLLPSQRTQRQVADVLRDPRLGSRLSAVLEEQGFNVDLFQPFFQKQSHRASSQPEPPPPLTYRDLSGSNLAALVRPFRIQLPGKTAFVTFLRDVKDPAALGADIAQVPGATLIDQGALMTSASESYRKRMVQLLVLGLLLVWLTLLVRYRNLRMSLAAFAPALLSAGVTVFVLFCWGCRSASWV
jgi:predicted exporter